MNTLQKGICHLNAQFDECRFVSIPCSRRASYLVKPFQERAALSMMIINQNPQFQLLKIIKRRLFINVDDMERGE